VVKALDDELRADRANHAYDVLANREPKFFEKIQVDGSKMTLLSLPRQSPRR